MSNIDYGMLRKYTAINASAEQLLSRPEKETYFNLNLKIGPDKLIQADSYVVYFNTVRGPAKGGIRMALDVTLDETRDLAERMVWKTALARIPFGGGKSGIAIDPKKLSRFEKTAIIKEYVHVMNLDLREGIYVPAPDMGTDATDMAVIFGELHIPECVTGKPPRVGGLPGRREATGRGVSHAALLTLKSALKKSPKGATAAVQGFGNVGSYTALFLHEAGVKVVAVSDVSGGRYDPKGLDIPALFAYAGKNGSLDGAPGKHISNDELLLVKADLLLPCARENQITRDNARMIRAAAIVEGANGPTTAEADVILNERKIPVVPDILANGGGVVASYVEWRQAKSGSITAKSETFEVVEDRIGIAVEDMLRVAAEKKVSFRTACQISAAEELVASLRDRDWI
jgi:glutamate dehydrogenase (NAD(P)+)